MALVFDVDVASLGLTDGQPWTGGTVAGTTATVEVGVVVAAHRGEVPVLRLVFGTDACAVALAPGSAGPAFTVHLVLAQASTPTYGGAVSIASIGQWPGAIGARLVLSSDGHLGWNTTTDAALGAGLHVLTVTSDGVASSVLLDGAVAESAPPVTIVGPLELLADSPGAGWDVARVVLHDDVPSSLAADIAALVELYVEPSITAAGSWGITGTATSVTVGDLPDPVVIPPAPVGGAQVPPAIPEAQEPPAGTPAAVIRRVSETMPDPVLDARGFPSDWAPTSVVNEAWGTLQVVVEGVDVTWWGGRPTPFPTWERGEPFGSLVATLTFPQITTFHQVPAWCLSGASVDILLNKVAGGQVHAWAGVVDKFGHSEDTGVFTVTARGPLLVTDLQLRQPGFLSTPRDVGSVIADVINGAVSRRTDPMSAVMTGCLTSVLGGWEPRITGYVQRLLSTAVTDGRQWTVACAVRTPVLQLKDLDTVTWTVSNGQRGVSVDLEQDFAGAPNVIYGEGISPAGGRWRNAMYPGWHPDTTPVYPLAPTRSITVGTTDAATTTGHGVSDWQARAGQPVTGRFSRADRTRTFEIQRAAGIRKDGLVGPQTWAATFGTGSNTGTLDAFFMPLAWAPAVMPRLYGPDGTDLGPNPDYDPDVIRVEDKIDFGQGVTKAEGKQGAIDTLARVITPGWSGTVTLEADPQECSKFEVTEGSNGNIRAFRGTTLKVHVAHVDASEDNVRLTVDTNARDYPTLDAIRDRERNATDPAKAIIRRLTKADLTEARATFDDESPAGQVPRHALFANLWTVIQVPFGAYGSIVRTELTTSSSATPFAVAVFDQPITAAQLLSLVGNPLDADLIDNPWDRQADALAAAGLLMAWGWNRQPGGYYPQSYSTPDGDGTAPVTGRLVDDSSWDYVSMRAPWVWVAHIASAGCWVQGRFYPGVD